MRGQLTISTGGGATAEAARAVSAGLLRPCRVDDLPAVARLFASVFRHRAGAAPQTLINHLRDVYFDHPWYDPETPSQVFVSDTGAIDGFIGVLPLRLRFNGQPLRAAIAGALMVRDPAERPTAGARLLRTFMAGPQALSLGDTANWTSKTMWERLGGRTLPFASMEWLKIIKPAQFGVSLACNRLPWSVGKVLGPVSWLAGLRPRRFPGQVRQGWTAATVDANTFLAAFQQISSTLQVSLDLDETAGAWLMAQAARKARYGVLYRRVVNDRGGRAIGCYLVYAKPGSTAHALQVLAAPRQGEAVISSLIAFAADMGCCAVRGQSQRPLMDALFKSGCLMRHNCATVADTDDADLMAALEVGSAPLGGFFGETWMRLVSDDFA